MKLDFEREMFLELHNEDGLLIMSKGLGLENLLYNLIYVYCDPRLLVLVLGVPPAEQKYIIDQLSSQNNTCPPKIGSEGSTKDRTEQYYGGGVIFLTPRILVVDLLLDRVPLDQVAGIIIYKAHKVNESCQETFILRLYRQKNKKGFVNAISDSPLSFTKGYCHLERTMRMLFVRKLFLWPRIHATVISSLDSQTKPHVIELQIKLSKNMKTIQLSLLELINFCVQELKKINPQIELDVVTVENLIGPEFNAIFKHHLDPVWHQFSSKSRRFLSDLKTLKTLTKYLIQYDCVTFYILIKSLKQQVTLNPNISDWLFLDPAESLFMLSKARVYQEGDLAKGLDIEMNPKWLSFLDVLDEINDELEDSSVLVITEDAKTSKQLLEFLSEGYHSTLINLLNVNEGTDYEMQTERRVPKTSNLQNLKFFVVSENMFHLEEQLFSQNIKTIIIYDPNVELVRRIEVYQAKHPKPQIKVYFLCYKDSVEEQFYLTSIRREKEAFEYLIQEKSRLVIPKERDGRGDIHPDLDPSEVTSSANLTVNSRVAGGAQLKPKEEQLVIVDMREFRSHLPSLIHRRGINIEPVTLEVGDYILAPDTCVERKSVSDLIGSLNSGRLFTQAQAMLRHYERTLLLIEFDPKKAFTFQGKYGAQAEKVSIKLVLLILHFPKLRIIWSPSPYFSAEIFERLKANRPQPDSQKALTLSIAQTEKYNPVMKDMLIKLPGVSTRNQWALLSKVANFAELCKLSEEELAKILENSAAANKLYDSLHFSKVDRKSSSGPRPSKIRKK